MFTDKQTPSAKRPYLQMSGRVPLLRVDKAGEHDGVVDEEDGRVVADQIPVALLGVDFDGEPARVAHRVGRAAFSANRGEPHRQRRLLAHLREHRGAAVLRDVVRDLQVAEGACPE